MFCRVCWQQRAAAGGTTTAASVLLRAAPQEMALLEEHARQENRMHASVLGLMAFDDMMNYDSGTNSAKNIATQTAANVVSNMEQQIGPIGDAITDAVPMPPPPRPRASPRPPSPPLPLFTHAPMETATECREPVPAAIVTLAACRMGAGCVQFDADADRRDIKWHRWPGDGDLGGRCHCRFRYEPPPSHACARAPVADAPAHDLAHRQLLHAQNSAGTGRALTHALVR